MRGLMCALALGSVAFFAECQEIWVRAGTVFDGEQFVRRATIVVREERIAEVHEGWADAPQGARVIDAADATVTPGFVESHSHFLGSPMPTAQRPEQFAGKIAEQGYSEAAENRLSLLECGITTVIDMGSPLEAYKGLQRDIAKGAILCPELFFPGPLFTAPGGHPAGTIYKGSHWLIDKGTIQTSNEQDAARKVNELKAEGVSFIKIVYDGRDGMPRLSLPVARAVIAEAHKVGLAAYAHVTSPEEAQDMIDAGADGLEHDFKDMPTLAQEMAARKVIFTPTIQAFRTFLPSVVPGLVRDVRTAYQAGVPVAVGTDFPNGPGQRCGDDYFDEIAFLEQSGASRAEVLHSATAVGALKAGQQNAIGHILPGYRANLVFFDGDLQEGAISRDRIQKVMFHGSVVIDTGKPAPSALPKLSSRSLIVAPFGFYDSLNSLVIGASLTDLDLLDTGILTSLTLAASFNARVTASLSATLPSPVPRTFLTTAVSFDNSARMSYARGNDSAASTSMIYSSTRVEENLKARAQLWGPLYLSPAVGFRHVWGSTIAELNDPNETVLGLSVAVDTRDCKSNPWDGVFVSLGGELSDRALGSTRSFQRATLDSRGYVSPVTHLTLATRILAQEAFGSTPAWYLPSFGGVEVGRGFMPHRFADNLLVASQTELRFPIVWVLHGAAFADFGEVAPDWASLSLDGIHAGYGLGLRFLPSPDEGTVLSFDAGFSNEGWTFSFRYGQAF